MSEPALPKPPSPLQFRDELEAMVLKELLGPGSADEEILESPGSKYFVGVLAPRKRAKAHIEAAPVPAVPLPDEDDDESAGEILDGDELALGGRDTTQDGTTVQAPAQDKALMPSSFGMTFSVNPEATELQLSAAWASTPKRSANTSPPKRRAAHDECGSGIHEAELIASN